MAFAPDHSGDTSVGELHDVAEIRFDGCRRPWSFHGRTCGWSGLKLTPHAFFTRLYDEIGDTEFKVETLKARFADGYLFADGTWTAPDGRGILRAADLFSAVEDGRIISLTVVWTHATAV